MHKGAVGHDRSTVIKQVMEHNQSVNNYAEYVPIGNSVEKIRRWQKQGAKIYYVTSRKTDVQLNDIRFTLKKYQFPKGPLEYRKTDEEYKDVVERLMPDIFIEDDCESIGGKKEMTYPQINRDSKEKITSVVVQEFGGLDHLPDEIVKLKN